MRQIFSVFSLVLLCGLSGQAESLICPSRVTRMEVEKGQYSPVEGAVFALRDFVANMVSRGKTLPLCLARTTEVEHGDVFVSADSLTRLFSQKVEQSKTSVSDVKVEVDAGEVKLSGKVRKGVELPFEIKGPVTSDGRALILNARKVKIEGLPVKALLGLVGVHLGSIIHSESVEGVRANGDAVLFEPSKIAHVEGKINLVQVVSDGLQIRFGNTAPAKADRR